MLACLLAAGVGVYRLMSIRLYVILSAPPLKPPEIRIHLFWACWGCYFRESTPAQVGGSSTIKLDLRCLQQAAEGGSHPIHQPLQQVQAVASEVPVDHVRAQPNNHRSVILHQSHCRTTRTAGTVCGLCVSLYSPSELVLLRSPKSGWT